MALHGLALDCIAEQTEMDKGFMEIKDSWRRRKQGLMTVVPAAPHYQGHWHQDQLRYAK